MKMALSTTNHDLALAGPVGSLDAYIQAVGSISVLSREEEQALSRSSVMRKTLKLRVNSS